MGYGFFEPRVVYGFFEENQTELICSSFLEEHNLERYALYTNKGSSFGFVYGKSCNKLEYINTIDKIIVEKVFEIVSKIGKHVYVAPNFVLALSGNGIDNSEYGEYDPAYSA